jgi:hypothetical protein
MGERDPSSVRKGVVSERRGDGASALVEAHREAISRENVVVVIHDEVEARTRLQPGAVRDERIVEDVERDG